MKCLVVEDEPIVLGAYQRALSALGFDVWCAKSCADAMYIMRTHNFNFFVLDLLVTDGETLCLTDYIAMRNNTATIVLVTGTKLYPNGELSQIAPRVDFVLRKPVNMSDLGAIAHRAEERQPSQERFS